MFYLFLFLIGLSTLAERRLQVSQLDVWTHQMRPKSCYLRELLYGNFIIKCEQLTRLENLGQGMLCMFTLHDNQKILLGGGGMLT